MLSFTIARRGGWLLLRFGQRCLGMAGLLAGVLGPRLAHPPVQALPPTSSSCPTPAVLDRVTRHRIAPGETLAQIAQRYDLLPTTLMGMNPRLRQGTAPAGLEIVIPPYNGILVSVPLGKTLQDVATAYGVRADVLFEVNGCDPQPRVVFVPGVNWSPLVHNQPTGIVPFSDAGSQMWRRLSPEASRDRYPLPMAAEVVGSYGWRVNPATDQVAFYSGVDLAVAAGTTVYAVADGTVAFVGEQSSAGQGVVINHQQGRQTRYAHLDQVMVRTGQVIQRGTPIGMIRGAPSGMPTLRFELRYRSDLGWVAQDPQPYLQSLINR